MADLPTRNYWAPHVTVAAVVKVDNSFLMVEEQIMNKRVMTQPAGHLDEGESLTDAIRREMDEETGLRFEPTALVGIYRWVNPATAGTWLRFTFTGDIDGSTVPAPRDRVILHADWFTESEIRARVADLRSPQVLASIEDYERGRRIDLDLVRDVV